MRAQELDGGWGRATPPTGYAVLGVFALALSLAGVLGGHHLAGKVFGVPEEEPAFAFDRESDAECPAHLRAADACDYDGDAPARREGNGTCASDHEEEVGSAPHVRQAAADGAARATTETLTPGR